MTKTAELIQAIRAAQSAHASIPRHPNYSRDLAEAYAQARRRFMRMWEATAANAGEGEV